MKYYLITILAFINLSVYAQKAALPLDDRGKYIYYEVVDSNKYAGAKLLEQALNFFKQKSIKNIKLASIAGDSLINAQGKFIINKTALIANRPSGEVLYNFVFEVKDAKYRFWLTDFEFIPYMRDRFGNFVPSTHISKPLEESPGKLNDGAWKQYVSATAESANSFAANFKTYMKTEPGAKSSENKKETISTKKW